MAHLTRERPKSLLEIAGKAIVEHSLDVLAAYGLRRATLVVGYRRELIEARLGARRGAIAIDYVVNPDFDTTEHGWSLALGLEHWSRTPVPVLMLDADDLYDPEMIDRVLASGRPDVVLVDGGFESREREEELVAGHAGEVSALVRARSPEVADYAGAFVGINRFSAAFARGLLDFVRGPLARRARELKYERILDAYLREPGVRLGYVDAADLAWINVNHEADLASGEAVARRMLAIGPARGD